MSGANLRKRARAVKPAERATYDACHAAMRAEQIYAWSISLRDGSWSVQSAAGVYALDGATIAQVRDYLASVGALPATVSPIRKPRTTAAELRARIAELEAVIAAAGLAVPGTVAA